MIKRKSKNYDHNTMKCPKILLIIFCIFFLEGCFLFPTYEDYVNSTIKPMQLRGIVLSKAQEETGCFGLIVVKQDQETDTLHRIYFCTTPNYGIWRYVQPGDSLFKEKGKLEIFVKRNDTTAKFIFPTKTPL
jgi:hypothetical protein